MWQRTRLVSVIAITLASALGTAWADEPYTPSLDPVAGARLFESKRCVQCHAIEELQRVGPPRSFCDLAAAMWNHLPQMAAGLRASRADTPYLTPGEMSDLAAYLYTPRVVDEAFLRSPGEAGRGEQLLTAKGCLGCHSLVSPRGKKAGSLDSLKGWDSPWTIIATMWNHAFLMEITTQLEHGTWPRFTSGEMADLVAFLRVHGYGSGREH